MLVHHSKNFFTNSKELLYIYFEKYFAMSVTAKFPPDVMCLSTYFRPEGNANNIFVSCSVGGSWLNIETPNSSESSDKLTHHSVRG